MKQKKLIVCVCRGNIARSPFAEAIITKELNQRNLLDKYSSISRGVQGTIIDPQPVKFPNITYYDQLYQDSKPSLEKFEINLSTHISTPINKKIADKASILIAMDNKTKQALLVLFPEHLKKVYLLSELINEVRNIIDPEGVSGTEKQEKIFSEIQNIIHRGFPKLLTLVN
jgi:protein-tyrosine-phosphatase